MEFLREMWNVSLTLAPSLVLGLTIAGILHVFVKRERIFQHLGKPGFFSSAKAALIGVPLPLCSCGVLPAALSLKRDGASSGAVTSFLISTPQTGVDSISVTWGVLGFPVALAKVVAAFVAGLAGGTVADAMNHDPNDAPFKPGCASSNAGSVFGRIWNYSFGTIFRDIYGWLAIGIAVSALITVFMEPGQLADYPLLSGPLGLLAALLIGIPMYVCSIASVPIAAGLIYAGFPVGSALVFLMAGPATNAATMGAVRKTLGKRVFWAYIISVVAVSLAAGLLLNSLEVSINPLHDHSHSSGGMGRILTVAAAAGMVAGMVWFAFSTLRSFLGGRSASAAGDGRILLRVEGMSCSMCSDKVKRALEKLPFVRSAGVSAEENSALLKLADSLEFDEDEAAEAIENAGYSLKEVIDGDS
ncbi:MAG: hypothetical protein GF388_01570 [Candidatus Aegiribacteria sp.]|nr:hypothetical protein [Candidatus Aegiribacteria sp.]MBD3294063.1 hypothetical protein [Candidatus Fermentibacteria bacterium]